MSSSYYFYDTPPTINAVEDYDIKEGAYKAITAGLTSSYLVRAGLLLESAATAAIAVNVIKNPVFQTAFATGMSESISTSVALISDNQLKVSFGSNEILIDEDGKVVGGTLAGENQSNLAIDDAIGASIIGVLFALAFPISSTPILGAGLVAAGAGLTWLAADWLGTYI